MMCFKIVNLLKLCDQRNIDLDDLPSEPKNTNFNWTVKFLEMFKSIYKQEKSRYLEPKLHPALMPFVKFLHER